MPSARQIGYACLGVDHDDVFVVDWKVVAVLIDDEHDDDDDDCSGASRGGREATRSGDHVGERDRESLIEMWMIDANI